MEYECVEGTDLSIAINFRGHAGRHWLTKRTELRRIFGNIATFSSQTEG